MTQRGRGDLCDRKVAAEHAIYVNPFGAVPPEGDPSFVPTPGVSAGDLVAAPFCLDCATRSFESEAALAGYR